MTLKQMLLAVGVVSFSLGVNGQSVMEMHMFSRYQNLGTARSAGTGGAFSALGNDFSSISINPAGAGVFRKEQIDVSVGIFSNSATTRFGGETIESPSQNGLTFTNFGKVWMINQERDRSSSFALTVNQNMSFREEYRGLGFAEDPSGEIFEPGDFYDEITDRNIRGTQYDVGLTLGFNEGYKWYYGFGVGIPISSFQQNYVNDQQLLDINDDIVGTSIYDEFIDVAGIGINARAGVIYRPIPALRIGLSAQSPTAHSFNGEFDFTLRDDGVLSTGDNIGGLNPNYRYTMYTSGRLNAGIAYVFRRFGLISIDYDYMNPSWGSYGGRNLDGDLQSDVDRANDAIDNDLQPMHFVRAGTEIRLGDFFIRGGYSFTTSGLVNDYQATQTVGNHLGFGYQGEKIGINLSLVSFTNTTGEFSFDTQAIPNPFLIDRNRTMFTIGLTILQ